MSEIKEIKFTPSFYIGQIVYDVTNGLKGVVVAYQVDVRDINYKVKFSDGAIDTCYKVELCLNYIE